jgi:hypothetical protein
MPTRPLTREQMQEAVDTVHNFHGNRTAAARHLGMDRMTLTNRLEKGQSAGLLPLVVPEKPRIRVPARSVYSPMPSAFGKAKRVFVWGCAHDSPLIPDKARFRNAGRLAAELNPDFIVDLGDSLDLDSLSTHAVPGSTDDRARPGFLSELESLDEAYSAFDETAPPADSVPRFHLRGNHENRADRFEANNPTTAGVYTIPLSQVFSRRGWSERQYREWLFIDGVGFTHVPINQAGKEYGGKGVENTVMNESTFSVVWSHTHKQINSKRPKIGIGNSIRSYNTGCFMPQGYIKQYAGLSTTGWDYGVSELTLRDGLIEGYRYWSELELRERFT